MLNSNSQSTSPILFNTLHNKISIGTLLIGLATVITSILFITYNYSPLFFGDYEQVISRMWQLKQGEISKIDFFLLRQIDHPHALVFFLSFLDIQLTDGSFFILYFSSLLFVITSIALLAIFTAREFHTQTIFFPIFGLIAIFLAGPQNIGFLAQPFQVAITGTTAFVVFGFFLIKKIPALKTFNTYVIYTISSLCFSIASLSHGAGIISAITLLILGTMFNRRDLWAVAGISIFIYAIYGIFYPPTEHLDNSFLIKKANQDLVQLPLILVYLCNLIGHGICFGLFGNFVDVCSGALGLTLYTTLIITNIKNNKANIFSPCLSTFGLLASLSSVFLNFFYADVRKITPTFQYFHQDRYLPWLSLFWLGTLIGIIILFRNKNLNP